MTVDTLTAEAPSTNSDDVVLTPPAEEPTRSAPAKKSAGRKTKTIELTLTVTGTADGEWRAELKQGSTYLARNLAVAAAAVARAAEELHEELSTPINKIIDEARSQQAAKVAALEAELEAAREALAGLSS
ncbi:DUF6319 family protein [soil metagenome]